MGINIKNNFGTVVDNHDGGIVIASVEDALKTAQRVSEAMGAVNVEDADFQDITPEQAEALTAACKDSQEKDEEDCSPVLSKEILEAPSKTFTNNSEFIWSRIRNAVMKYYKGKPSNLAYIAAVADDWGMLKAREKCKEFVHSCIAIGAIPYEGDKKTYNIYDGMRKKLCGQTRGEKDARYTSDPLPCDYKTWSDSKLRKKIALCDDIAKEFEGAGMVNRFEKRRGQR